MVQLFKYDGLSIVVNGEKIPLTEVGMNEILFCDDCEIIVIKGNGIVDRKPFLPPTVDVNSKKDVTFDAKIYCGNNLVMELFNAIPVSGYSNGNSDTVELQAEFWMFGKHPLSVQLSDVHKKNTETAEKTRPDYSDCDD